MSMRTLVGRKLGQYQIVGEVGRGGMAIVYRAYQPSLGRYVAIKVLPPQFTFDRAFVDRFLREARAAAQLKHPNIVTIHDIGVDNDIYYIVMEEIEGRSLKTIIDYERPLTTEFMLSVLGQVAAALDAAHAGQVVHRDVKPANILVAANGHAKLTDFGIAKPASGTDLTRSGLIVGTPEYMSPEQAMGERVDHRSDIYSLAVICYELLAGRTPYAGEWMSVIHAHAFGQPRSLCTQNPNVTPAIERVVFTAMARKPDDRHNTAGDFINALAVAVADGRLTPPPGSRSSDLRLTPPTAPSSESDPTTMRRPTPSASEPGGDPTAIRSLTPSVAAPLTAALPAKAGAPFARRLRNWSMIAGMLLAASLIAIALFRWSLPHTPQAAPRYSIPTPTPLSQSPSPMLELTGVGEGTFLAPVVSATIRLTATSTSTGSATPTATASATVTPRSISGHVTIVPTNTPAPTNTSAPPTNTPATPTDTPIQPTDTPVPLPADTPTVPPTDTPVPLPTSTFLAFHALTVDIMH